ncbi:MAG TPA: pseudouridine synthase [Asticcacaulis sp.]|nr:pseudouridine synthase [Asticcacaulis sp.]
MTQDSNAGERDEAETPREPTAQELKAQQDAQDMADGHLYMPQELREARDAAGKPERKKTDKKKPDAKDAKPSERIAKVLARAGLASRREVERLIGLGKIAVNGRILDTPAVLVKATDVITVDGQVIGKAEPTRLWRYHKPVGLVTTHRDPEGRSTVFDKLPAGLPRVISVGRLDLNSEGLLLLTNDGELARALEKPSSGWVRRYRARALGHTTQARLDRLKDGTTVDGVIYGPMEASLDKVAEKADGRANVWLTVSITEGKNREVRKVLESIGLKVNRLIRLAYGPFQLGNLEPGDVEEVGPRVIRELLGDVIELRNLPPEGASQTRTPGRSSRDATSADGKPVGRRAGGDRFGAGKGDEARKPTKSRRAFEDRREFKDRDFDERPRFEGDGESRDRRLQREFKPREFKPRADFGDRAQGERKWAPRPERSEGQNRSRPERSEGQYKSRPERSDGQGWKRPERSEGQGWKRPERSESGERAYKPRKDFGGKAAGAARPERGFMPRRDLDEAGAYERAKTEFGPGAKKAYKPRDEGQPRAENGERKWTPRPERSEGQSRSRPEHSEGQGWKRPERSDGKWTPRPENRERTRAPKGEGGDRSFGDKSSFSSKPGGKPYGGKPGGKSFAGKPSGPRKPRG